MKKIYFYLCIVFLHVHTSLPIKTTLNESTQPSNLSLVYGPKGLNIGAENLHYIISLHKKTEKSSALVFQGAKLFAAQSLKENIYGKELAKTITYLAKGSEKSKTKYSYQEKSLGQSIVHCIIMIHKQMKKATSKQLTNFQQQLKNHPLPDYLGTIEKPVVSLDKKDTVAAQGFAHMLMDMAIMMLPQFAATESLQWVNAQDGTFYTVLSQASTNLQTDFSTFQTNLSTFEQQNLTDIMTSFTSARTAITNESTQAQLDAQAETTYLSSMTSLNLPQSKYLYLAPTYDVCFEQGNMFTPSGQTWRNPVSVGDWEFDPSTASFWQYNLVNATQSGSTSKAANNYIFTELYTNNSSYEIDCDITLYSVSYPFYAGIIFNKARWISGDMSGFRRYRTIGIYAASKTDIGVYFAEQYYDSETDFFTSDTATVHHPVDQIFAGTAQKIGSLVPSDFDTMSTTELTYSFKITTSSDTINATFGKKGDTTTTSTSITSQDPSAFVYHGLGFVSPGAVAQYTINQPTALLFSDSAIEAFQEEVATLLQSS